MFESSHELAKGNAMANERQRLLELALESLENRRKSIEEEISAISRELRGGRGKAVPAAKSVKPDDGSETKNKRSRFSKEERIRRSQRMKAYWDNWRKKKNRQK
jgi:hypothetical protein